MVTLRRRTFYDTFDVVVFWFGGGGRGWGGTLAKELLFPAYRFQLMLVRGGGFLAHGHIYFKVNR
jgi:hypothetical protein